METKSSSFPSVYPKILNHVAVSVPDLDLAVKWYKELFGFTVVRDPIEFVPDDTLKGMAVKDIHGPSLKKVRMVWLMISQSSRF